MSKRGYGSGALYEKDGVWYGRWHTASGTRPHRRVGLARKPGSRDGFTRSQAERELRRLMDADEVVRSKDRAAPTFAELGAMLEARLQEPRAQALDDRDCRVPHTDPYRSVVWRPRRGPDRRGKVEAFVAALGRTGRSSKTVRNVMGTLHSLFELARRRKIVRANPCQLVELPKADTSDAAMRFLDQV
jgi:hypothetical protein